MSTWTVFRKELRDAVRDRRTWLIALVTALAAGPAVLALIGQLVAGVEESVARREVVIEGTAQAPTLVNFLQRAGATVVPAPEGWRERLRQGSLANAVIVPPADFETQLARGAPVVVEVYYDDSHERAQAVVQGVVRLLAAFQRELGTQRLLARGISPQAVAPLDIEERNLAPPAAAGARLLFVVPWAALLVAVFGALPVAIDVTAGERERGSLEPLLTNPVPAAALAVGKWGVVMVYSAAIVALTMAGFLLALRLIPSENLAAVMQLQWREVGVFLALLLPFAALMAAANMLAATFGRSHKEAQTYVSYLAMGVQFAALAPVLLPVRDAAWQWFVPAIAQLTVLLRALRGEAVGAYDLLLPAVIAAAGTAVCLWLQARLLTRERIVFARA
ncbi:MAG: ABC transporter permease subunit [Burkholderiaceae bacterium]|nr:ABC transporter permease subunit [Burkholderiaceae bacterium]